MEIGADTSVWIDHLRRSDRTLSELLDAGMVLIRPFVLGELALGDLRQRRLVLEALSDLPRTGTASDAEVVHFIDRHALFGRGIGYVDVHLLSSVRLTADTKLWTHDQRLRSIAAKMKLAFSPS